MLLGLAVNLASAAWGEPVLLATLFVCIALAIKGLDALVPGPPSLVIAAGLTYGCRSGCPAARPGRRAGWAPRWRSAWWCTRRRRDDRERRPAPVAAADPGAHLVPGGQPQAARFRTGGAVESWLVAPALTVSTLVLLVLVIPGVLPVFTAVRDQVERLFGAA